MAAAKSFRELKVYLAAREAAKKVFVDYRSTNRVEEELYSPITDHHSHMDAADVRKKIRSLATKTKDH